VTASYPLALAGPASDHIRSILDAVEHLDKATATKLAPLEPTIPPPFVSASSALRQGRYVHFDKGLRFTVPSGPAASRLVSENASTQQVVVSHRDDLGLQFTLEIGEADDVAKAQAELIERLTGEKGAMPAPVKRASGALHRKKDFAAALGFEARLDVRSIGARGNVAHVVVFGAKPHVDENEALIEAAERSLRFEDGPIERASVNCPSLRSEQFGVTLTLPGNGWTCSLKPTKSTVALDAERGKERINLFTIPAAASQTGFVASLLEREALRRMPPSLGAGQRTTTVIGPGITVQRLIFKDAEVGIVRSAAGLSMLMQINVADPRATYGGLKFD